MSSSEARYAFGANWQSYVDHALTPRRIAAAATSLRTLLGVEHLRGRTFLDVGCGSGLFSLAACLLGAERVMAFDYDDASVRASEILRSRAGISTSHWSIFQGSILDSTLVSQIEASDIVYSWGVLHHTGAMWQAIDNAAQLVRPEGLLAIAIYNHQRRWLLGSAMWWRVKRRYNRSSRLVRRLMEIAYVGALTSTDLCLSHDPFRTLRLYREDSRGMDFWHDVRDWLGGFPYEYATADAVAAHLSKRHGFELIRLQTSSGAGCNEFTFRAPTSGYGQHSETSLDSITV
jgi:2-polyprenyl-3-methyl-5-hydroxy-6-metoxy-1,4-benzoquinol methylase